MRLIYFFLKNIEEICRITGATKLSHIYAELQGNEPDELGSNLQNNPEIPPPIVSLDDEDDHEPSPSAGVSHPFLGDFLEDDPPPPLMGDFLEVQIRDGPEGADPLFSPDVGIEEEEVPATSGSVGESSLWEKLPQNLSEDAQYLMNGHIFNVSIYLFIYIDTIN